MAKDVICTATYSRPQLPSKRASEEKRKIQIKEMMTWLEMLKTTKIHKISKALIEVCYLKFNNSAFMTSYAA